MNSYKKINKSWLYLYGLVLMLSIFQVFIFEIKGSYISLALVSIVLLLPLAIKNIYRLRWTPFVFFILIFLTQVVSLSWSPDIKMGLKQIVVEVFFTIVFLSTYTITVSFQHRILLLFKLFFILLLIPGALVILFHIFPSVEDAFLRSNIAQLFINPNSLHGLFDDMRNNVLDEAKSGGFFVNGNVAAAYFGLSGFFALGMWKAYSKISLILFAASFFIIAISTGSKSSILLISILVFYLLLRSTNKFKYIYLFSLLICLIILAYFFGNLLLSQFVDNSIQSLMMRFLTWNYLTIIFWNNILTGVGFGGWQLGYENYSFLMGMTEVFPPHNTLIYLWSQSGIIAIFFLLAYYYKIINFSRKLLNSDHIELKGLGISVLLSNILVILHGMGDNFGIIGDDHMFIVLASILGFTYARYRVLCLKL